MAGRPDADGAAAADCRPHFEGNSFPAGLFEIRGSGLSDAGPQCRDTLRRREPAHPAGHADRQQPDGGAVYFRRPSIGLHQRDNDKLLATLQNLRDLGNSLIVVEHDEDTMRAADYLIDIGPGAGVMADRWWQQAPPAEVMANPDSLTGQYLSGKKKIEVPAARRAGNGKVLKSLGRRRTISATSTWNSPSAHSQWSPACPAAVSPRWSTRCFSSAWARS